MTSTTPSASKNLRRTTGALLALGWSVTLSVLILRVRLLPSWLGVTLVLPPVGSGARVAARPRAAHTVAHYTGGATA